MPLQYSTENEAWGEPNRPAWGLWASIKKKTTKLGHIFRLADEKPTVFQLENYFNAFQIHGQEYYRKGGWCWANSRRSVNISY